MKTRKARTFLRVVAVLAVAVTGGNLAQAQTCSVTWTANAGDGLWSTAGNWSPRHVPGRRATSASRPLGRPTQRRRSRSTRFR